MCQSAHSSAECLAIGRLCGGPETPRTMDRPFRRRSDRRRQSSSYSRDTVASQGRYPIKPRRSSLSRRCVLNAGERPRAPAHHRARAAEAFQAKVDFDEVTSDSDSRDTSCRMYIVSVDCDILSFVAGCSAMACDRQRSWGHWCRSRF